MDNWKYKKWREQGWEYQDIGAYIGMEIYPEDIEIFSTVLLPNLIEYKNRIFIHDNISNNEADARKCIDLLILNFGIDDAEKLINRVRITDLFINKIDNTEHSTCMNIAKLIKHNWEYHLLKKFPNKDFIVAIIGEAFEPEVVFYQKTSVT